MRAILANTLAITFALLANTSVGAAEVLSGQAVQSSQITYSRAAGGALGQAPTAAGQCVGGAKLLFGAIEWTHTLPGACLGMIVASLAPALSNGDLELRMIVMRILNKFEVAYFGEDAENFRADP